MSPHPATRRNGTCTGSLWKSHSRNISVAATTAVVASASAAAGDNNDRHHHHEDGGESEGRQQHPSPPPSSSSSYFEGALAEANERQRTHHEFCVLVGDELWSYTDVWAYVKGDPPTVSCLVFEGDGTTDDDHDDGRRTTTTTRERYHHRLVVSLDF